MAEITRLPLTRHLRSSATTHVRHVRRGRVVHDGPGLSFWYSPLTAALSEVPVDDREQPVFFHARTADFQDVAVQASVTYRFTDPSRAATRLDFEIGSNDGRWRSSPLEQVGGLLSQLAQQHAVALVAGLDLPTALTDGVTVVRDGIAAGLGGDPRLDAVGLEVADVRVVGVTAEPELERALQTPVRELVQQEADKATFERRATAVEHERAIAENELQNQIELARREEQLVAQRGQNERSRATEKAAADRIESQSAADNDEVRARARAEATRLAGAAEGEAETARMAAYAEVDQATLVALAMRELAGHLPEIGTLHLAPDTVAVLLDRLTATGGGES